MGKKIVSFIVILLAYIIIGGAVLIATSNYGLGFAGAGEESIKYAYALDRAGDIYYIIDEAGDKSFVSVDSSGKKLFEKKLTKEQFGDSFYVDSIYIEHDKNIYLTVYNFDTETRFINKASVYMFYEDGSYADRLFTTDVSVYPNACGKVISSFSEDDTNVYFALMNEGNAELFSVRKDNQEPYQKVAEYNVSGEVYGFCATSSKGIAVGSSKGITIYAPDGERRINGTEGMIADRFWNGISSLYVLDSATGSIYVIDSDNSMTCVVNGSKVINAEEGITTSDMSDIAIGITGNIFGAVRGESERLYLGSFSVMNSITIDSANRRAMVNRVLATAATCIGVILFTILTWDFFISILKMRLSILLRQSLLIALLMFVSLYALSFLVIIPTVKEIVTNNYIHEAQLIANSFEDSINGMVYADGVSEYDEYESFLSRYGSAVSVQNSGGEFAANNEKPSVCIAEESSGALRIVASGDLYPAGYPADMLMYDNSISKIALQMQQGETCLTGVTPEGDKLFLIRRISLPVTSNTTFMIVSTSVGGLSGVVDGIEQLIDIILLIGGVVVVIFFMIIENITAGAVRRLKRSVDRIANGEYSAPINIRTGDEVEELSVSVKALAAHIIDKTTSLERLNNSYYRFVPQMFLANLGETQIERVGKSLHAEKRMTVLSLRFNFSMPLSGMNEQDIFDSINSVYEYIMPIIDANGGTGYNFLFNGLTAIFPDSTESALMTAIKIRETIAAYNEVQQSRNRRTCEVRIVISEGDVLLGFIGDDKRMEPTVVSSALNESEQIEKILADSGLYIVCTESAFRLLPSGKYRNRCIGSFVTAEGKTRLFDMFDSDPYSMIKLKEQFMTRFELGVNLFAKQDYVNARNMFLDIVKYAADDGVSRNYMYLSEHNISAEKKQTTYSVFSSDISGK